MSTAYNERTYQWSNRGPGGRTYRIYRLRFSPFSRAEHVSNGSTSKRGSSGAARACKKAQDRKSSDAGGKRAPDIEHREDGEARQIYDPSALDLGPGRQVQRPQTEAENVGAHGQSWQVDVCEMELVHERLACYCQHGGCNGRKHGLGTDQEYICPLATTVPVQGVLSIVRVVPFLDDESA